MDNPKRRGPGVRSPSPVASTDPEVVQQARIRNEAAQRIQNFYRGVAASKHYQMRTERAVHRELARANGGANDLQGRGTPVKKKPAAAANQFLSEEEQAAIKIQAHVRGHMTRMRTRFISLKPSQDAGRSYAGVAQSLQRHVGMMSASIDNQIQQGKLNGTRPSSRTSSRPGSRAASRPASASAQRASPHHPEDLDPDGILNRHDQTRSHPPPEKRVGRGSGGVAFAGGANDSSDGTFSESDAATLIQAQFRGYKVRKSLVRQSTPWRMKVDVNVIPDESDSSPERRNSGKRVINRSAQSQNRRDQDGDHDDESGNERDYDEMIPEDHSGGDDDDNDGDDYDRDSGRDEDQEDDQEDRQHDDSTLDSTRSISSDGDSRFRGSQMGTAEKRRSRISGHDRSSEAEAEVSFEVDETFDDRDDLSARSASSDPQLTPAKSAKSSARKAGRFKRNVSMQGHPGGGDAGDAHGGSEGIDDELSGGVQVQSSFPGKMGLAHKFAAASHSKKDSESMKSGLKFGNAGLHALRTGAEASSPRSVADAVHIQSSDHDHHGRPSIQRSDDLSEEDLQHMAATRIQAVFRGHRERKNLAQRHRPGRDNHHFARDSGQHPPESSNNNRRAPGSRGGSSSSGTSSRRPDGFSNVPSNSPPSSASTHLRSALRSSSSIPPAEGRVCVWWITDEQTSEPVVDEMLPFATPMRDLFGIVSSRLQQPVSAIRILFERNPVDVRRTVGDYYPQARDAGLLVYSEGVSGPRRQSSNRNPNNGRGGNNGDDQDDDGDDNHEDEDADADDDDDDDDDDGGGGPKRSKKNQPLGDRPGLELFVQLDFTQLPGAAPRIPHQLVVRVPVRTQSAMNEANSRPDDDAGLQSSAGEEGGNGSGDETAGTTTEGAGGNESDGVERGPRMREVVIQVQYDFVRKPYLGGFRHKQTGVEYLHATCQTIRKPRPDQLHRKERFSRDCQTVPVAATRSQQTTREQGTQIRRHDHHIPESEDRIMYSKPYFDSDRLHALRVQKAIQIQALVRGYFARKERDRLLEEKFKNEDAAVQLSETRRRELEDTNRREIERRMRPRTRDDFEILYTELQSWVDQESYRIKHSEDMTEDERRWAFQNLLDKETKLLQTIDRLRIFAKKENREGAINGMLSQMSAAKKWSNWDGQFTHVETPFTIRARELKDLYDGLSSNELSIDERLEVLLHVKWTVKEFDCALSREIVSLIDREADLLNRGRKENSVRGLRSRINNLFLQFIQTPEFNPESTYYQKCPIEFSKRPQVLPLQKPLRSEVKK